MPGVAKGTPAPSTVSQGCSVFVTAGGALGSGIPAPSAVQWLYLESTDFEQLVTGRVEGWSKGHEWQGAENGQRMKWERRPSYLRLFLFLKQFIAGFIMISSYVCIKYLDDMHFLSPLLLPYSCWSLLFPTFHFLPRPGAYTPCQWLHHWVRCLSHPSAVTHSGCLVGPHEHTTKLSEGQRDLEISPRQPRYQVFGGRDVSQETWLQSLRL